MKVELRTEVFKGEWTDISSEIIRQYHFGDTVVQIDFPCWLHVSASGGHRILDEDGYCHYIRCGWEHIMWRVKKDAPHFVK